MKESEAEGDSESESASASASASKSERKTRARARPQRERARENGPVRSSREKYDRTVVERNYGDVVICFYGYVEHDTQANRRGNREWRYPTYGRLFIYFTRKGERQRTGVTLSATATRDDGLDELLKLFEFCQSNWYR